MSGQGKEGNKERRKGSLGRMITEVGPDARIKELVTKEEQGKGRGGKEH